MHLYMEDGRWGEKKGQVERRHTTPERPSVLLPLDKRKRGEDDGDADDASHDAAYDGALVRYGRRGCVGGGDGGGCQVCRVVPATRHVST